MTRGVYKGKYPILSVEYPQISPVYPFLSVLILGFYFLFRHKFAALDLVNFR